jgi:hypothetical protein
MPLLSTLVLAAIALGSVNAEDPPPEMAQAAFDVGVMRLPAQFQGNTVEWVLRFGTLAPRGTFETADEYAARRRKFRSEVFAFVPERYDLDLKPAAGSVVVTVYPGVTRIGAGPDYHISAFDIHRTKLRVSSRAGPAKWSRNDRPIASERGAVLAEQRVWKQTQIVVSEPGVEFSSAPLTFALPASPDSRKVKKGDLRVALVCMPRLEQYDRARDAPIAEATGVDRTREGSYQLQDERTTVFVALRVRLLQVWMFSRSTGQVYGRFTPQGAFVPRDGE